MPYPEDIVRLLSESNVYVVPTAIVQWIYSITVDFPARRFNPEVQKDYPPDIVEAMEASLENFTALTYFQGRSKTPTRKIPIRLRQLIDSGARVVVGTDSGTPMNFHTESTWREMQLLVENGMTPLEAISAATKYPAVLMRQAESPGARGAEQGTIEPGKLADVILVRGSVLENIANLQNVEHVIKGGKIYK